MKLLMISGDTALGQGREGAFYHMLSRFARYWERIDVICPRASGSVPRVVFGNVHVHPSSNHKAMQYFYVLRAGHDLLSQHQHDLIVSHDYGFFYNGIAAARLSKQTRTPYVSEILHIEGYPRSTSLLHSLYRQLAMLYIRWAAPQAAAFRVMNRVEMPEVLRRLGVADAKILVLPAIYIDFDMFRPMPDQPKRYDVIFVGRLAANKGVLTIIDALSQIKDATLCIVGEGPLRAAIDQRIQTLGLGDRITIIDRANSTHEIACLYNQSQMLVCASTAEGGPRVTVEAMACGVPVISTPVGVMRELITDGENGLVFHWNETELAQKIRLLRENGALRARIAEVGRQSVQLLQADAVIEDYARGYHELIERLS